MLNAKACLQHSLRRIAPQDGKLLHCMYTSEVDEFVDVENVRVYNVRSTTFSHSTKADLAIQRRRSAPPHSPNNEEFEHFCEYRFDIAPKAPIDLAVKFTFVPTALDSLFEIWWAATSVTASRTVDVKDRFGVFLELHWPDEIRPAAKIKKMLDGVLSSLHRDPSPDAVATARLATSKRLQADIRRRLINPPNAIFPYPEGKRLVRPFRTGVQWHPADHKCDQCTFIVRRSPTPSCTVSVYHI